MSSNMKLTRRGFLSGAVSIGLGSTLGTSALLSSCVDKDKDKQVLLHSINELYIPELPDKAMDGRPLKAALIGWRKRHRSRI